MSWIIVGSAVAIGLFLSAFFSGAETGLYRVNRLRLHLGVKRRDPQALRLASVLDDEQGALSVTLVGTNMANYLTTSAVAYLFAELLAFGEGDTELYTVAILTPIVFVFGEVVPKNLFQLHADTLLARGSRLLVLADRVFRIVGVVSGLTLLAGAFNRLAGGSSHSVAGGFIPKRRVAMLLQEALASRDLRVGQTFQSVTRPTGPGKPGVAGSVPHVDEALSRGSPGEDQSDLIDRVCQLSETRLHAVMVPRNRVTVIAADTDRRGLMRIARRTGHDHLPVYESGRRHIIAVVKVDELLSAAGGPEAGWQTVGEYALRPSDMLSREAGSEPQALACADAPRELKLAARLAPPVKACHPAVLTLSPHETVATAITRLRQAGRGMAIVTDHGGRMLGVVTLKDLIEEIVGETALY